MRQKPTAPIPWLTVAISWQRLLALVCFGAALLILSYSFVIRPALSAFVGRQVSQQIGQEVADEIAQAVVTGALRGPAAPAAPGQAAGQHVPAIAEAGALAAPAAAGAPVPAAGELAQAVPQGQAAVAAAPPTAGAAQPPDQALAQAVIAQIQPSAQAVPGAPLAQAVPGAPPASESGGTTGAPPAIPQAPTAAPVAPVVGTPITAPVSERSIQEIVETLPPGEITVTEQKLNAKIAPRVAGMAPIERVEVRFVPGMVRVTLAVFGKENLATAGLAISGDRVVVRDPQLEGPLGVLVSAADLVRPIEEELNNTLELAGREVRAVRIEQGQIVVTLN